MAVRIELLGDQVGREKFACGVTALDEFLARRAGQQQRKGFGKTYLAIANSANSASPGEAIAGFVTLSAGQVATTALSPEAKLPRHPAPVLRIGRLAVDQRFQGQGIGRQLLAFALQLALEFSARVGIHAVMVDAKNDSSATFYQRLGFRPTLDNPLCLYLPLAVLRQTTT